MMDALHLEVKKDSWKQNQDGTYKLTLTLNPTDLDDNSQALLLDFIKAGMGTRYMIGMAEIGDDEQPVAKPSPARPEKDTVPFHEHKLSWQSGVRCNDDRFQEFLRLEHPDMWPNPANNARPRADIAADIVRSICEVETRADLDFNKLAASSWIGLNADFEQHIGLATEAR